MSTLVERRDDLAAGNHHRSRDIQEIVGGAAVGTALSSALSLDFLLRQPFLRLTIPDKHDVMAFAGLALCGLLAAAFSSTRAARATELRSTRE